MERRYSRDLERSSIVDRYQGRAGREHRRAARHVCEACDTNVCSFTDIFVCTTCTRDSHDDDNDEDNDDDDDDDKTRSESECHIFLVAFL